MSRVPAPSLPTAKQIREVHETVAALFPGVRISQVGPGGVVFEYPEASAPSPDGWRGKPFAPERT